MLTNDIFFFDTYALIELIKGNLNYKRYKEAQVITTILNLMELYHALLRDFDKRTAERYFDKYLCFATEIPMYVIKEAMQFKLANKKDRLSYVNCIGYALSTNFDVKFLTGDIKFKDKPNVEFVR